MIFDIFNPKDSIKACVSKCPDKNLDDKKEFTEFTMKNNLCLYNVTPGTYNEKLCPRLPVHKT